MCVSTLFHLLGWKLSEDKLVPYDECCKVLGVELNLVDSPANKFTICNTQSRKDELLELIRGILEDNVLSRSDGERLRGPLQFASNQVFGRRFKNCLRELNIHVSRGFKTVSGELANALMLMTRLLELNQPRQM